MKIKTVAGINIKIFLGLLFLLINVNSYSQLAIEWQNCLGTTDHEEISTIDECADGGFIGAGKSEFNFYIVKTDSSGNQEWMRTYGGTATDNAHAVLALNEGGFLIGGETQSDDGDVTGFHGQTDGWLIKLDGLGNIIWKKCLGGTSNDYIWSMLQLPGGNYLVAATTSSYNGDLTGLPVGNQSLWLIEIDTSGTIVNNTLHNGAGTLSYSLKHTNDGGYVLTGNSGAPGGMVITNYGSSDLAVVKLDSSLTLQWCKNYGGSAYDKGVSVINTSDNNYLVVGKTSSNDVYVNGNHGWADFWVVKLDSSGDFVWQKCLGGNANENELFGVYETAEGNYLIAGLAGSTNGDITHPYDGVDFWIASLDTAGSVLWDKSLGGGKSESAGAFMLSSDGGYILAGGTTSNDFDVSGHTPTYNIDTWIAKVEDHPNMIKGKAYIDANSNQVYDAGEMPLVLHPVREQNSARSTLTTSTGDYILNLANPGSYIVTSDSVEYSSVSPVSYSVTFIGSGETDSLNDFAYQPSQSLFDLSINVTVNGVIRPGFTTVFHIEYQNLGTITMDGQVKLIKPAFMNYSGASEVPVVILPDTLIWDYTGLMQWESRSIDVELQTAVGTLGIQAMFIAEIQPIPGDVRWFNNRDTIIDEVVGSFDPNDITVDIPVLEPSQTANPPYLEYLIRFQNTGTYLATFIEIANPVSSWLDMNTFELIALSHPGTVNYLQHSRNLDFYFDNINLPDSVSDEPGSHGFIRYRVKPYTGLAIGDTITNYANIYFDYNPPVITNFATTIVNNPVGVYENAEAAKLVIYPNPAVSKVYLRSHLPIVTDVTLNVYNMFGERVHHYTGRASNRLSVELLIDDYPAGVYLIELITGSGYSTARMVKVN
ncbi:MAG: T9SS type A sorting domain-containing protein [Bacteroidetes bacterium]|nr:T9SS type A sorting domain-containing protein [Bacteroidota bacterium]